MIDKIPETDYAFPWVSGAHNKMCPGMTLRDWFAGQAFPTMLDQLYKLSLERKAPIDGGVFPIAAEGAYMAADAMLAERAK